MDHVWTPMERYALPDPHACGINFVAAAVCSGAGQVMVTSRGGLAIEMDGPTLDGSDLDLLFTGAFPGDDPGRRLEELAVGLFNALRLEPAHGVQLECWEGETGTRLRVTREGPALEPMRKPPRKGVRLLTRMVLGQPAGWNPLTSSKRLRSFAPLAKLLEERCRYAPIELSVNGQLISAPVDPGPCVLWAELLEGHSPGLRLVAAAPQAPVVLRERSGAPFSAVLGLAEPVPPLVFVTRGRGYPVAVPLLEAAGLGGAVAAYLTPTADGEGLQENRAYSELLVHLGHAAVRLHGHLLRQQGQLDQESRQLAWSRALALAEHLHANGRLQPADELLAELARAQEGHPQLGITLRRQLTVAQARGGTAQILDLRLRLLEWHDANGSESADLVDDLNWLADAAARRQDHAEAARRAERACALADRLRPDSPQGALSKLLLAAAWRALGEHPQEVERLLAEVLAGTVADPLDTARAAFELAQLCRSQQRYHEARKAYQQALTLREGVLGRMDPEIARTLEALGELLREQGRGSEAGATLKRAFLIWGVILGEEHSEVQQRRVQLIELFRLYGRYDEAEALYLRLPEPPALQLGLLCEVQGRLAEARGWLGKLPEDDPGVLWHRARLELAGGEPARAQELLGRARAERVLIADLEVRLHRATGDSEAARRAAREALTLREESLGPEHPELAPALATLGEYRRAWEVGRREAGAVEDPPPGYFSLVAAAYQLYARAGQQARSFRGLPDAERDYCRALATLEEALGPGHPTVAAGLDRLGRLYRAHRRLAGAQQLLLRSVAIRERWLGADHAELLGCLPLLAEVYQLDGQLEQARQVAERAAALARATLGGHPATAAALEALGDLLLEEAPERAGACYAEAQTLQADSPGRLRGQANCCLAAGELERAADLLEALDETMTDEGEELLAVLDKLAMVKLRQGESEVAELYSLRARVLRVELGLDFG